MAKVWVSTDKPSKNLFSQTFYIRVLISFQEFKLNLSSPFPYCRSKKPAGKKSQESQIFFKLTDPTLLSSLLPLSHLKPKEILSRKPEPTVARKKGEESNFRLGSSMFAFFHSFYYFLREVKSVCFCGFS